jgi:Fe-S-cluster containining protein
LKENRCTIYTSRPKQCREFPFWNDNISSKEAWEEASIHCEGINHKDAPLLSPAEIEAWRKSSLE